MFRLSNSDREESTAAVRSQNAMMAGEKTVVRQAELSVLASPDHEGVVLFKCKDRVRSVDPQRHLGLHAFSYKHLSNGKFDQDVWTVHSQIAHNDGGAVNDHKQ